MFTGLIQRLGELRKLSRVGEGWTIEIGHEAWPEPLAPGESVAVHGACLTVASASARSFRCNTLGETLARTSLAGKRTGARLNLERALRLSDRLGGHLVAGHVDATGSVEAIGREGLDYVLRVGCPPSLTEEMVKKGSVACDGVSLTIAALNERSFDVHIVPVTWDATALVDLRPGDSVNVETDMIGKYVRRFMATKPAPGGVEWNDLHRAGFL